MNEKQIRAAVESILSRPANLIFYCATTGSAFFDGKRAAEDFFTRAATSDVSPVRFFDPNWFRSRYRVTGPNAFLSYLQNPAWRLAVPSPVFAPRWYARRYSIASSGHPLLDFLLCTEDRNPHPLLDVSFLRQQSSSWNAGTVAFEYLIDAQKFPLKPHPLFDTPWYLARNPDVAAAGVNPLEHYLHFGHAEGRWPNRLFNVNWYREVILNDHRRPLVDPLTSYVTDGFYRGTTPSPGLSALVKTSIRPTEYGPSPYIEALEGNHSLHAALRHLPRLDEAELNAYLSSNLHDFNPLFPEDAVLLREARVALMFSGKSGSARIVYWWLDQKNLLEAALKFSQWSHTFENIYRRSRDYVQDALMFDPAHYQTYKLVRSPLTRAASSFTHLLRHPEHFGIPAEEKRISFMEFLERVAATNFMGGDGHVRPQLGKLEQQGKISPKILKIEQGLNAHLRSLEKVHGLPASRYDAHTDVRQSLGVHARPHDAAFVGPETKVPYRSTPDYRGLLTPDSIKKIYDIYRMDFEAYGYAPEVSASRR